MANPNISIIGNTFIEGISPNKLNFTISISEPLASELKLNYSTFDGNAVTTKDYTGVTNIPLTFAPGETVKTITVDVLNDDINEVDENLFVNVFIPKLTTFNPSTTDLLVATGIGTITDTLSASTTTTLLDSTTTDKNTIENLTLTGTGNINAKGNKLNNILIGNSSTNLIEGLDGQDTLDGKVGADTLQGGISNDTYIIDSTDTIAEDTVGGAGVDMVQANFNYTLGANLENLILTGASVSGTGNELGNFLTGNNLNNSLSGNNGNDTIQGNGGADTLQGGLNDDTYMIDATDTITETLSGGIDSVQATFSYTLIPNLENIELLGTGDFAATGDINANKLTGNSGNNTLTAASGNDTLTAGSGDDVLYGGNGDDSLEGGLENDTLYGGIDNDVYVLNSPEDVKDVINESVNSGTDQVNSVFSYTLQNEFENLVLIGTENINGTGNDVANSLIGNSGNNVLNGLASSDIMAGGLGNDIYVIERNTDTVVEAKVLGIDSVESSVNYLLGNDVENLVLTGTAITGTGNELNNYLVGNNSSNNLAGNAGNDSLDGGAGNDTMIGSTGNDVYIVDTLQDIVTETSSISSEIDLVQSLISQALGNNLENLELMGTDNLVGTGNSLNNKITGNSGNNNLVGNTGNDTLGGNDGNDSLLGEIGNDSLDGGLGIDSLDGGDANDTLKGGNDNDSLLGGINNDSLDGGLGSDTLNGGLGDDTYVVDNFQDIVATLDATDGVDTVQSSITYRLGSHLENLTLTGASSINGNGNELNNIILGSTSSNTLDGKDGNDSIDGSSGNDFLKGGAGNDTLKGNSGTDFDTLIGGVSNDDYYVGSTEDVIIENFNEGSDQVFSTANTYTLSENLENLILSGTTSINGTGNTLNNTITGNTGFNIIDGGVGNDTMIGGTGNDNYVIDNAGDAIIETSALVTEIDTVFSSVNYTLPNNVVNDLTHYIENLILTGTANLAATGNALNNLLVGNSGNNVLRGNDGNDILDGSLGTDVLEGGVGNDTYVVDNSADVITELSNTDVDTAKSYVSNTLALANNVENLVLLGTENLLGTGNTLANVITGNSGNNDLKGGSENDTLIGGAGNDTINGEVANDRLSGGFGADQFSYNSGVAFSGADFGSDRIIDFVSAEGDKIVLGKTTFGLASIVGSSFSVANEFASVTTDNLAKGSAAKIVYSGETGNIFYNNNGSTIGSESVVTTVSTSLSASDFTIV